jgi:hypothetical protein
MSLIRATLAELYGLFVDDGHLASQVLVMVLAIAGLVRYAGLPALVGASALVFGCLLILAISLRRKLRR